MPEISEYAEGTPSWVDVASPDIDAAVNFYSGLFGWDVQVGENAEQTGGYRIAHLGGKSAAGMMPLMQEGQPPAWSTYIAVDDADATAQKVTDAGGSVVAPPMDVMDLGRMAVFTDPTGAFFGIWQAKSFIGAEVKGDAGARSAGTSSTPATRMRAKEFYAAVFGWDTRAFPSEDGPPYWTIHVGGDERTGSAASWTCAAGCPTRSRRTGSSTSRSTTPTRRPTRRRSWAAASPSGRRTSPTSGASRCCTTRAGAMFAILKPNPRE